MSRPIVSYDDITLPYDAPDVHDSAPAAGALPPQQQTPTGHGGHPPPSKKRKKNNNQKSKQRNTTSNKNNWSNSMKGKGPSSSNSTNHAADEGESYYDEGQGQGDGDGDWEGEADEEESRELTHEEIWDDSALVDAWDAAMEEYEAYHGTDKDWKQEPVKKSALWYNVPIDPTKISGKAEAASVVTAQGGPTVHIPEDLLAAAAGEEEGADGEEENSKPIDFNTFVPTYDPTLHISPPPAADQEEQDDTSPYPLPTAPLANYAADFSSGAGQMVSQDEAFQRALSAMYWGGYWTAMYHAQRHISSSTTTTTTTARTTSQQRTSTSAKSNEGIIINEQDNEEEEGDNDEDEDDKIQIDDDHAFVSTQR